MAYLYAYNIEFVIVSNKAETSEPRSLTHGPKRFTAEHNPNSGIPLYSDTYGRGQALSASAE